MAKLNDEGMATGGGRNMKPGDTFTFTSNDGRGNTGRTYTIIRTDRPYVFDLCDAYNQARHDAGARADLEYYVDGSGQIRLGDTERFTKENTERIKLRFEQDCEQWKRAQSRAAWDDDE